MNQPSAQKNHRTAPPARPFLTDVQTLRARARQHMEKGAVTQDTRRTLPPW